MKSSVRSVELMTTVLACLIACSAASQDLNVGDDAARVPLVLGTPKGYLKAGFLQIYYYDRGRVEVRDGKVTTVELVTAEEAVALHAQREEQRLAREKALAAERARLTEEGLALKQATLDDPDFQQSPASAQVGFWKRFMAKYPDVPVDREYAAALSALESETTGRRIEELEQRVAEAEQRVQRAEAGARENQGWSSTWVGYYPPLGYWSTPLTGTFPRGRGWDSCGSRDGPRRERHGHDRRGDRSRDDTSGHTHGDSSNEQQGTPAVDHHAGREPISHSPDHTPARSSDHRTYGSLQDPLTPLNAPITFDDRR